MLLETGDPYLDRYTLPMRTAMPPDEVADWRERVRSAGQIVADRHRWAAEPMADVISVIVPLTPRSDTDLVSATTPAAYGAIATSWPPDEVTLAETLVHEFQHVKLCGLLDMVPLASSGEQRVYAPWRQDPRPAGGLLQGVYAHLGIVRFWQAQQHAETDPDGLLRAQVLFARWRPAIGETVQTLLETGSLTPAGVRFAERLRAQGQQLMGAPLPVEAAQIAAEVALDHRLTWQLRHVATDVPGLADAYRRGEPCPGGARTWTQEDVRKVDSSLRSRAAEPALPGADPLPGAVCRWGAPAQRGRPPAARAEQPGRSSGLPHPDRRFRRPATRRLDRPSARAPPAPAVAAAGGAGHQAGADRRGARPAGRIRVPDRPTRPGGLVHVTELLQVTGHPAPWPHRDLDVAAMRARGHEPVPFRQFILKVHSRCNLSCTYCYVYEMADQGWPDLPRRMDTAVAAMVADRIGEHARAHDLPSVDVILHGGEPLLAGTGWLTELAGTLRARVPAQVDIGVQTNGTLLRPRMLQTLKQLGIGIGVSLDGDAEATGRHRLYPSGRNSFDDVADGLRLLGSPGFREIYSGILCTIDVQNDPLATYEAMLAFRPPAVDLLLPHANWSCPPPGTGYADWLIAVFERWYSAPEQETRIRLFAELIQLVLGNPGAVEGLGLAPSTLIVVDTDGSIKQLDSLSSAYDGAAETGLHVSTDAFDAALGPSDHGSPADRCRRPVRAVPAVSGAAGLRRRSLPASLPERRGFPAPLGVLRRPDEAHRPRAYAGTRRRGPAQYGSISAVSRLRGQRRTGLGMLCGQRVRVTPQRVVEHLLGRRLVP